MIYMSCFFSQKTVTFFFPDFTNFANFRINNITWEVQRYLIFNYPEQYFGLWYAVPQLRENSINFMENSGKIVSILYWILGKLRENSGIFFLNSAGNPV